MFTGLATPSHLIVVLAILLLLFGAKRIPELAKGLGTGIKEFHEGISSSDDAKPEVSEQTARAVETTAPINSTFPIAGYDEKNVEEISRRLKTLTGEQLRRVKDYERRNKNRETLVREIDRNIAAAS